MAGTTNVSMKLLIDKINQKVLFAEASKEVVDFLFNILALPVGTVVRLLTKEGMVGCLANLYESIEGLNDDYIVPKQSKDTLLKPMTSTQVPLLLLKDSASPSNKKFYRCGGSYSHSYVTDYCGTRCPSCSYNLDSEVSYVGSAAGSKEAGSTGEGGFVKGVVTYMVMDDLIVQPMSTISSITLLNKFNIKEVGSLEDRVVSLDMAEGVKLLKASLQSKSVLTDVFLRSMEP